MDLEYDHKRTGGYLDQKKWIRIFGITLFIISHIISYSGGYIVTEAQKEINKIEDQDPLTTLLERDENEAKIKEIEYRKTWGMWIIYIGYLFWLISIILIFGPKWILMYLYKRRNYRNQYLRGRF